MSAVLAVTAPIYLVMLAGFVALRSGYLPAATADALGAFVLRVGLPVLVFSAVVAGAGAGTIDGGFVLAYGAASLAVLLGGAVVLRRVMGQSRAAAMVGGIGMAMSNSAFLGYPLVLATLGTVADRSFAWVLLVENVLILPLGLALADLSGSGAIGASLWRTGRRTLASPIVLAMAAGLAAAALGLRLPAVVAEAAAVLRAAVPGLALFVVGAIAAGLQVRRLGRPVAAVAVGKLFVHPLAVALALLGVPDLEPQARAAALIFAACPMITVFPILGSRFGVGPSAAAAFIVATGLSFVTTGAVIWMVAT